MSLPKYVYLKMRANIRTRYNILTGQVQTQDCVIYRRGHPNFISTGFATDGKWTNRPTGLTPSEAKHVIALGVPMVSPDTPIPSLDRSKLLSVISGVRQIVAKSVEQLASCNNYDTRDRIVNDLTLALSELDKSSKSTTDK